METVKKYTKGIATYDCNTCGIHERLVDDTVEAVANLLVLAGEHKRDNPTHLVYTMDNSVSLEPEN